MNNGAVITTTDYAGNYIYQNNALQFINQPEGYLEPNGQGGYDYAYSIKVEAPRKSRLCGNHLGNIRLTFVDFDHNGNIALSEITQENNYYPFGLKHQGYNNAVSSNANAIAGKYKYNGKELQDELDLDWYDYGARFYDPQLGLWHTIDPLAEKYFSTTPFGFVENNPLLYLDPDGQDKFSFNVKLKLTSGKVGVEGKVAGVGVGGNYNLGGNEQTLSLSISFNTKTMKLSAGVGFSQKTIEEGSYSAALGPFIGGKSEEKETKRELTTDGKVKTEDKKFKTVEKGGLGVLSTEDKEGENTKYKVEGDVEVNTIMIGTGVSVGFEYEGDGKNSNNQNNSGSNSSSTNKSNNTGTSSNPVVKEKKEKII